MSKNESANSKVERYSHLSADRIMREFNISSEGLDSAQVLENRQRYGDNTLLVKKQDTYFYCLKRAFINPFSIILFILGIIAFITDVLMPGEYQKSFTSVVIIFSMLI